MIKNHGGGKFAKMTGSNRKSEARYEKRAVEFAKMVSNSRIGNDARDATGYTKPGSRKKVGG
jgi:hypothetical protein